MAHDSKDELFEIAAIGTPLQCRDTVPGVEADWKWAFEARGGKVFVEVAGVAGGCKPLRFQAELTQADVKRLAIWLSARAASSAS